MSARSLIARNLDIMSGAYTIRGRRITVTWLQSIRNYDRWSIARIATEFRLTKAQVQAALAFRKHKAS